MGRPLSWLRRMFRFETISWRLPLAGETTARSSASAWLWLSSSPRRARSTRRSSATRSSSTLSRASERRVSGARRPLRSRIGWRRSSPRSSLGSGGSTWTKATTTSPWPGSAPAWTSTPVDGTPIWLWGEPSWPRARTRKPSASSRRWSAWLPMRPLRPMRCWVRSSSGPAGNPRRRWCGSATRANSICSANRWGTPSGPTSASWSTSPVTRTSSSSSPRSMPPKDAPSRRSRRIAPSPGSTRKRDCWTR